MKKRIIYFIFFVSVVFSSCNFNKEEYDDSNAMYEKYIVDEEVLKAAGLPIVSIKTENKQKIKNKEDWIPATFDISNTENNTWDLEDIEVSIRGRGNYSWTLAKKPFALKFSKKQNILGMPKHKRWVLIANYSDHSFMKNTVAFSLSEEFGMDYTVRGEYVNLLLNGNYVGLYWLGEAIKVDDNRVNIDEENDYLIEVDVNFDENWEFKSNKKNLPYMIKNDDFMTDEKLTYLSNHINAMESILYGEYFPYTDENKTAIDDSYKNYIDIESFAKFYLVNEIMFNEELKHPKSCYFTLKKSSGILKAGPVWDFDWAGYNPGNKIALKKTLYYDALFTIPEFKNEVNTLIQNLSVSDVSQNIYEMKTEIKASAELDGKRWGTFFRNPVGEHKNSFDEYVDYLNNCITSRINYMKQKGF